MLLASMLKSRVSLQTEKEKNGKKEEIKNYSTGLKPNKTCFTDCDLHLSSVLKLGIILYTGK